MNLFLRVVCIFFSCLAVPIFAQPEVVGTVSGGQKCQPVNEKIGSGAGAHPQDDTVLEVAHGREGGPSLIAVLLVHGPQKTVPARRRALDSS